MDLFFTSLQKKCEYRYNLGPRLLEFLKMVWPLKMLIFLSNGYFKLS